MSYNVRRLILIASALVLSACVTRGEIEEIKKNQEKILAKLDSLSRAGAAQQRPQRPRGPDRDTVYSVPIDNSPVKGPNDALVTLVIISEFQCPFSKRATATLEEIEKTYSNDIRFVFKHNPLPFHNRALPAANAATCANEQGKFWKMHDLLFAEQQSLDDAGLEAKAKTIGLNIDKFKNCLSSNKYSNQIKSDQTLAVRLGARGTPAFFINGKFLSGAQPFPAFKALIDAELKKAKDSGVAKSEYYEKQIVEKGKKSL
ncbi:MAG: DsbA family protein [Deltaproteobacteria bacterium]|nr:DsbA family protein [Deltaproteobacteria bacterium]